MDIRSLIFQAEEVLLATAPEGGEFYIPESNHFADGLYARELHMKAGMVITSKIHKTAHFTFVMKGKAQVIDENSGAQLVEAPCFMKTEPGTKRILKILEDSVWLTVHATESQDVAEIEENIIAKSYAEFDKLLEQQL